MLVPSQRLQAGRRDELHRAAAARVTGDVRATWRGRGECGRNSDAGHVIRYTRTEGRLDEPSRHFVLCVKEKSPIQRFVIVNGAYRRTETNVNTKRYWIASIKFRKKK